MIISRVDGSRHVRMQVSIKWTSIVLYLIDRRRNIDPGTGRLISVYIEMEFSLKKRRSQIYIDLFIFFLFC